MGDAILIHSEEKTFIDKIIGEGIEWFTNGKTSHVEIYVGGGEGKTIGARIDGVKIHKISDYFQDKFTVTVRRVKNIRVDQAAAMKERAYQLVAEKYKYDIPAYWGFIVFLMLHKLRLDFLDWRKFDNLSAMNFLYFCSEVWDECACFAHADCFPEIGTGFVTPQDIMGSPRLETVCQV